MKYVIRGLLKSSDKVGYERNLFTAVAIAGGKVVAEAPIDENGAYALDLEGVDSPDGIELCVRPTSLPMEQSAGLMIRKPIYASAFLPPKGKAGVGTAIVDSFLPADFLRRILLRAKTYKVHGFIWKQFPTYADPLPAMRIDFYEVDTPRENLGKLDRFERPGFLLRPLRSFLGSAHSGPDGSYSFSFRFGSLPKKPTPFGSAFDPGFGGMSSALVDAEPDIRAEIHQNLNGVWTKIFDAPMLEFDWDIEADYRRDYFVPEGCVEQLPPPDPMPEHGFRFTSLGLIPIDNAHFVGGYVTKLADDPIYVPDVHHQPLCATLSIYGWFGEDDGIAQYSVECRKTDASGVALNGEDWIPVTDPLSNMEWNETTRRWTTVPLGPVAGKYRNIDGEPHSNWHLPNLKVTWNSANHPNGFYKLRISGFAAGAATAAVIVETPSMRIDNTIPTASFEVTAPAATPCGALTLGTDRKITFRVTAHDPEGHVLYYTLSGTRGRDALSAGANVHRPRPNPDLSWEGVEWSEEVFEVSSQDGASIMCATMAYHFHLCVQGSATNGSASVLASRRACDATNLVVSE